MPKFLINVIGFGFCLFFMKISFRQDEVLFSLFGGSSSFLYFAFMVFLFYKFFVLLTDSGSSLAGFIEI